MKKILKIGLYWSRYKHIYVHTKIIWWRSFQVGFEGQLNVVSKLLGLGKQENNLKITFNWPSNLAWEDLHNNMNVNRIKDGRKWI